MMQVATVHQSSHTSLLLVRYGYCFMALSATAIGNYRPSFYKLPPSLPTSVFLLSRFQFLFEPTEPSFILLAN